MTEHNDSLLELLNAAPIDDEPDALEDIATLHITLAAQRSVIAALAVALEFYAAERHYEEETGAVGRLIRIPSTPDQAPGEFAFEADWGETARAALALVEEVS